MEDNGRGKRRTVLNLYMDGASAGSVSDATGGLLAMPARTPITIAARADNLAAVSGPNGTIGSLAEVAIYRRLSRPRRSPTTGATADLLLD